MYVAQSISLAHLELLVHVADPGLLPSYSVMELVLADADLEELGDADLPADWRSIPAPKSTALIGDEWLDTTSSLALSVPSAIVPLERNYLLNPNHRGFEELISTAKVVDIDFDPRL